MSVSLQDQYDKIYKYCYFKVKNKEVAEDITQETFLKYFSQNSYINKGKPIAYLYTIAKNLCMDYFRKTPMVQIDNDLTAKDNIETNLTNLTVKQAVQSLREDLAEIVLLRFSSELAIGEIASFLGISRFAVYRKTNAALKALKSMLRKGDFYE